MAENLTFDRTDDGDLAFALTGDWKDYELWFAWRPEADCLQLCLSIDMQALKAQRARRLRAHHPGQPARMARPLRGLERRRRGGVPPRLALPQGERPTLAQAASMIDAAMEAADRFYPAFDFLLKGGKTPDEAMAACMFETVGQA